MHGANRKTRFQNAGRGSLKKREARPRPKCPSFVLLILAFQPHAGSHVQLHESPVGVMDQTSFGNAFGMEGTAQVGPHSISPPLEGGEHTKHGSDPFLICGAGSVDEKNLVGEGGVCQKKANETNGQIKNSIQTLLS